MFSDGLAMFSDSLNDVDVLYQHIASLGAQSTVSVHDTD